MFRLAKQYKSCTGCAKFKHWSEFSEASLRKDGLQSWCKQCNSTYQKNYQKNYNTDRVK